MTRDYQCEECSVTIPNCELCDDENTCTFCEESYVLSSDGTACLDIPDDCSSNDHDLIIRTVIYDDDKYTFFECPQCDTGFYWVNETNNIGGECTPCTEIHDQCEYCNNNGECEQCREMR